MSEQRNGARAVLWDVDGTLIDSREYHWLSWQGALAAENFPVTREQFERTFGRRNEEILGAYFPDYDAQAIARVGEAKEVAYRELVRAGGIELLPGVRAWLERLREAGWRQALASSAPRLNLDAIVSALGIEEFFEAIASAEKGGASAYPDAMNSLGYLYAKQPYFRSRSLDAEIHHSG